MRSLLVRQRRETRRKTRKKWTLLSPLSFSRKNTFVDSLHWTSSLLFKHFLLSLLSPLLIFLSFSLIQSFDTLLILFANYRKIFFSVILQKSNNQTSSNKFSIQPFCFIPFEKISFLEHSLPFSFCNFLPLSVTFFPFLLFFNFDSSI